MTAHLFPRALRNLCLLTLILGFSAGALAGDLVLGDRRVLTSGPGGYHPRWSPDATQIAYVSGDWPDIDIYLIPAVGGERTLVPSSMSGDLALSWHPDGENLAFDAYIPGTSNLEIHSLALASGTVNRLTTVGAFGPAWNSDGTRLAFSSGRTGNGDIYSVNADLLDLRRHTSSTSMEYYQHWSPDGSRLAFSSIRSGNTDVWIVDVATGIETRFTTDLANDDRAVWSPDGNWLAWDSLRDGQHHVYTRPVMGGETICLTSEHSDGGMADWSPDGSSICYVAEGQIWILELAGISEGKPESLGSLKSMYR
jgi:TolB protein